MTYHPSAVDFGDIFDLRDISARARDLAACGVEAMDEGERDEFRELRRFERTFRAEFDISTEECGDGYEPTVIPADRFTEYAEQLADDIGAFHVPADPYGGTKARDVRESWPLRHIDWKAAADELRQDYSEFDFDGRTYLIRSW
jgi:hypothetical protein